MRERGKLRGVIDFLGIHIFTLQVSKELKEVVRFTQWILTVEAHLFF